MTGKASSHVGTASTSRHGRDAELAVLYVSTYPPRKCGIATFTRDLTDAMDAMLSPMVKSKIMAMNRDDVISYHYPSKVILQLVQGNEPEYVRIARKINAMPDIRLVNIQHEFGIFGGEWGSYLIPFMRTLRKPIVINLHTVLPAPGTELRSTVQALVENASAATVMTNLSKNILVQDYEIPGRKIRVIPHGIHPQPFSHSRQAKAAMGFSDRQVISTFGLLHPGKGLEYVIEALPEVVKHYRNFVYLYLGATHPVVLKEQGEIYRNGLIDRIHQLGLYEHVRFYNTFFPLQELLGFLKATDIYVSPGLDPNQAVSGTLSYALGMGRPVISTPFANAQELITDDVGILVEYRNPQAYSEAIVQLLQDDERREALGKNAYFKTRSMVWPNVALQQAKLFSEHARSLARTSEKRSLPKLKLNRLIRLTTGFGILQFGDLGTPDTRHGYTVDDNARALVAVVFYYARFRFSRRNPLTVKQQRDLQRLMNTYLDFLAFAARGTDGFQNYVRSDRTLDEQANRETNLEDANSRALYALAVTATTKRLPRDTRAKALSLLLGRYQCATRFESPRAVANWVKALCVLSNTEIDLGTLQPREVLREQADRLVSWYHQAASEQWQWFEHYLTYSNAVLCEALLLAYPVTREPRYLQVGKTALDFLVKQSFVDGIYMPVGQDGWHHKDGRKNRHDQQPEEVKAMVYALKACHAATKDDRYHELMGRTFGWFLGDNSLKQVVYDRTTGGCYDGLGRESVNLNQGAESTVVYLLARLAFEYGGKQ